MPAPLGQTWFDFGFPLLVNSFLLLSSRSPYPCTRDWNHAVGAKLQNNRLASLGCGQNPEPKPFTRIPYPNSRPKKPRFRAAPFAMIGYPGCGRQG